MAESSESGIINRLLEAFDGNNHDALNAVLSEQAITFLDNDVSVCSLPKP
jgi:hypothetical protein